MVVNYQFFESGKRGEGGERYRLRWDPWIRWCTPPNCHSWGHPHTCPRGRRSGWWDSSGPRRCLVECPDSWVCTPNRIGKIPPVCRTRMFHFDKDLKIRPQAILDWLMENLCIILLKVVLKTLIQWKSDRGINRWKIMTDCKIVSYIILVQSYLSYFVSCIFR